MAEVSPGSLIERVRAKLGLDTRTLIDMLRGPLPPTIGLAVYQSNYFSGQFSVFGYLVAVVSILSGCLQPRVAFVKSIIVTLILLLVGLCITLLAGYCTIKARENTTPAGHSQTAYNSSAAAVTGIWLIAIIWFANTMRAYRPAFNVSLIIFSIYTEITVMTHVQQPTMHSVINFDLKLLWAMVLGCILAIGVNLFMVPTTSREVFFGDVRKHLKALETVLQAESSYMASFEQSEVLKVSTVENLEISKHGRGPITLSRKPEAVELQKAINSLTTLHTKTRADLSTAKQDIAWSSLGPQDLHDIFRFIRRIVVVLRGLTVLMGLYERLVERRGWGEFTEDEMVGTPMEQPEKNFSPEDDARERKEWGLIFRDFRDPIERMKVFLTAAFQHVGICLGLIPQKSASVPPNIPSGLPTPIPLPGSTEFGQNFKSQVSVWHESRSRVLRNWQARRKERFGQANGDANPTDHGLSAHDQEQLLVILYLQHLFHGLLDCVQDLLTYAEDHDVRKCKKRLILPGRKKTKKLIRSLFHEDELGENGDVDEGHMAPLRSVPTWVADPRAHPEYLNPRNAWQRFGRNLRQAASFFASPQSLFGLRVACAVMCVAIIALLADTSEFFFRQRLIWAMIIIAFSMNSTSGASFSTFLYRLIGSFTATVASYANWYIVDGHPAGVLVMYWLFNTVIIYFSIKYPKYAAIWRIHMITTSIMVGYALQTRKTGVQAPPATNSEHYPMYLIAPYRLATTIVGVFVAFVWTIFPAPQTARSILRKRLGEALFVLATYYSSVHATLAMYLEDAQGDTAKKTSPGRVLEKIRGKLFIRELAALASLREHSALSRFEPTVGGEFPHALYDQIITEVDALLSHVNLIAHAAMTLSTVDATPTTTTTSTSALPPSSSDPRVESWKHTLARRFRSADFTSHSVTTLLSLLASCIMNGQPLPPFLEAPKPYHLVHQLHQMDPELLGSNQARNPGYSAFAVTEVSATMMAEGLRRLLGEVKELVGEVGFEFEVEKGEKRA